MGGFPDASRGKGRALVAVVIGLVLGPSHAAAQAWVTPPGEGAVTVVTQGISSTDHVTRTGARTSSLGRETLIVSSGEIAYGVSERLSAELSLAWLATKWVGRVQDRHGPLDTGEFHASFQDIRIAARYQLVEGPVNVAPFVAYGGPVTDYETRGHSAFGRHLEELTVGGSVGGRLARRGYWQTTASYAFVNDIDSEDFNLDHVNGEVELGATIGARWTMRAFGSGQWMWDGLQVGPQTDHLHLLSDHDRFTQSSFLNAGGGLVYSLSPRLDLGLTGFVTLTARNFHALKAVATSLSWRFGGGFRILPPVPDAPRTR